MAVCRDARLRLRRALETGMNRAAELAAGEAREIFWNAIAGMTISGAFGILLNQAREPFDTVFTD